MNIILAGRVNWKKEDIDIITNYGKDIVYICPDEESPISISHNEVDVVIGNWFFKYHNIKEFSKLKYIQLLSSGYNGINPNDAIRKGIVLQTAKDVYSIPISEFVIGNILAFYKGTYHFYHNKEDHIWEKNRDIQELFDKKVLIVGTGSIGHQIAIRIKAFTPFVYGCNRTIRDDKLYKHIYLLDSLIDVVSAMDIIILTVALAEETTNLIDTDILSRMKRKALIVNVSRGGVIDENALIEALEKKKIGGAILDVFEQEPLDITSPLWSMENTIITPHNAFVSDKNNERLKDMVLRNYKLWENSNG